MILSALLLQHDEVSRCWPCQPLDVSGAVSCSHQLLVVSPWWELVNLPNYIKFFMKYVSLCFLRSAVMRAYVDYDYACLLLTAHQTRQTQHSPAGGEQLCCILHTLISASYVVKLFAKFSPTCLHLPCIMKMVLCYQNGHRPSNRCECIIFQRIDATMDITTCG